MKPLACADLPNRRDSSRTNDVWRIACVWCVLAPLASYAAPAFEETQELIAAETVYADYLDARDAVALIESGWTSAYAGKNLDEWQLIWTERRAALESMLQRIESDKLSQKDVRALTVMRATVKDAEALPSSGDCRDALNAKESAVLRAALYSCFEEHGNHIRFDNETLTRVAALEVLTKLPNALQRRELFLRFTPLWSAVNARNEPNSPYRRMIALAAQEPSSPVQDAANLLGISVSELERWLVQALATWRESVKPPPIEPWDYRYVYGAAERDLELDLDRVSMLDTAQRYYTDLGAQIHEWHTMVDLAPRRGKAPLAYADFVRRGRMRGESWQPTLARISGSYSEGGLGTLNELVHEFAHVTHMMALRTRPAFMDLGDAVFFEAFADVPSWSLYEPAWQRKYLQREVSRASALRALYSNVMLDIAWALFDLRMLAQPASDPNAVWTDITHRYLNIAPHPELPWWCLRVQLVESPGYMVNYGVGAFVTADLRAHITARTGSFTTGNDRWFDALASELLYTGAEYESGELLRRFLGRKVQPDALLHELRSMRDSLD